MVWLTRFDGTRFVLNADLIEHVEATPDTVITLTNEHHYVVREEIEALLRQVIAFTATLYGVGSANMLWLPLASKLKRKSTEEAEHAALIIDGVAALQAGDNPRIVREKLAGYVGPAKAKKGQAAAQGAPAAAAAGA